MSGVGTEDTGVRERVVLETRGGLLVGRPQHSSVELITIHAPEIDRIHLIVRELRQSVDKQSLLFAAPAVLAEKMRRATIYLKSDAKHLVVFETVKDKLVRHVPQPVAVMRHSGDSSHGTELLAVAVNGLGPFWLVNENAAPSVADNDQSARSLLGIETEHALLPVAAAVLLLILGRIASLWVHRLDRHAR